MKTTFSIAFIAKHKKANSNGESPIYGRITISGERAEISTGLFIQKDLWELYQNDPNSRKKELVKVREELNELRATITRKYREMINNSEAVSARNLKFKALGVTDKRTELIEVANYFYQTKMAMVGKGIELLSAQKYLTTINHLKECLKKYYGKPFLPLSEVTYRLMTEFQIYLQTNTVNQHNGMTNHLKRLKSIAAFAQDNGFMASNPFANYKLTIERSNRTNLELDELEVIENKEFDIPRLQVIKDLFVFSCYTGLAYIDAMTLTKENLQLRTDGAYWIIKPRKKSNVVSEIPLMAEAKAILDRYSKDPEVIRRGGLLPSISNQRYNGYLKEIADLCGVAKKLSTHVARHTFATTLCANNGVPIETCSKMLGHTSIKTTQIYYKVNRERIINDMIVLRGKLSDKKKVKTFKWGIS